MTPLLSILVPGVPSRIMKAAQLVNKLSLDSRLFPKGAVEVIWLVDNWNMTLGGKRNRLIDIAQGQFFSFVDDDDTVSDDYVQKIVSVIQEKGEAVDVVTFRQDCEWNGVRGLINFKLGAPNGEFVGGTMMDRAAWHVCAWKKDTVKNVKFAEVNWGEDQEWANEANRAAKTEHHMDEVLHFYQHIPNLSESLARQRGQR